MTGALAAMDASTMPSTGRRQRILHAMIMALCFLAASSIGRALKRGTILLGKRFLTFAGRPSTFRVLMSFTSTDLFGLIMPFGRHHLHHPDRNSQTSERSLAPDAWSGICRSLRGSCHVTRALTMKHNGKGCFLATLSPRSREKGKRFPLRRESPPVFSELSVDKRISG